MEENTLASENATETPVAVDTQAPGETEAETTTSEAPEQEPQKKRPSRAKARIEALSSDKRAAIEYAEFHRKQADELRAKLDALQQTETADVTEAPDISKYDDASKWAADTRSYLEKQAERTAAKAVEQTLKARDIKQTEAQRKQQFTESLEAASEKYDDYWEVVYDENATFMNGQLLETVMEMPQAGDLVYHLNSNPEQARKLATMTPARMAAELGRLESTLTTETKPQEPKPNLTKAPDPPSEITGTPEGEVNLNKVGIDDYMRIRREQLKERRGY